MSDNLTPRPYGALDSCKADPAATVACIADMLGIPQASHSQIIHQLHTVIGTHSQASRWAGDDNIESPFNACQHKGYCASLKASPQLKGMLHRPGIQPIPVESMRIGVAPPVPPMPQPPEAEQLAKMSREEKSLLLYFETRSVDYGGTLESVRMNSDDFAIAKLWNKSGFVKFGRIAFHDIKAYNGVAVDHWCELSEQAWSLAHAERRARCNRVMARLTVNRLEGGAA